MDWVAILQAIVLGVVEGVTEFLPISSTGHQIIAADLMGFVGARAQAFNIIIQLAAIFAVMWEFRKKITETIVTLPSSVQSQQFCLNLMIAFLPAGVLAIIFSSTIKLYLFNPITVSVALVLGGVVMLWAEKKTHTNSIEQLESIRWHHALKIGCVQSLALIPGTSRSASTIIGGLFFGLSRKVATEFSFFLAMPTMIAAALYSGYKYRDIFVLDDLPVFIAGFVTSFVFAMIAIKSLLKFIAHHSYAVFAWYRIIFGMLVLATWYFSWIEWSPI